MSKSSAKNDNNNAIDNKTSYLLLCLFLFAVHRRPLRNESNVIWLSSSLIFVMNKTFSIKVQLFFFWISSLQFSTFLRRVFDGFLSLVNGCIWWVCVFAIKWQTLFWEVWKRKRTNIRSLLSWIRIASDFSSQTRDFSFYRWKSQRREEKIQLICRILFCQLSCGDWSNFSFSLEQTGANRHFILISTKDYFLD